MRTADRPSAADRDRLAERNLRMARIMHAPSARTVARRVLFSLMAALPRVRGHISPRTGRPRIVLFRPDHIGDVLLTTPALRLLREAMPDAEILMLVNPVSAPILIDNPDIDHLITIPFPGFMRGAEAGAADAYARAWATAEALKRLNATHAVILRPDHGWGAWAAARAGIPVRIGYDLADTRAYLTHRVPFARAHAAELNARLIDALVSGTRTGPPPALQLPIGSADRADADALLARHGIEPGTRIIAVHPGAGALFKRWDVEKWAKAAETLAYEREAAVVFTGGPGETELIEAIRTAMHPAALAQRAGIGGSAPDPVTLGVGTVHTASLAGETPFAVLAAVYARAEVVLGADSGPMHIAVAAKAPTVTLYGPADPAEFGPWGSAERHRALFSDIACRPCRILDWGGDDPALHPCVREIGIGRVLEAARLAMNAPDTR